MIPGSANPLLLKSAAAAAAYQASRSLRFSSNDSAYLSRTPAVAGNRKTWTWAGWVKRSGLGSLQFLMATAIGNNTQLYLDGNNRLVFTNQTYTFDAQPVLRDLSAWYHFVATLDTTAASAADRFRVYINGVQVGFVSPPTIPLNTDFAFNQTIEHNIGRRPDGSYFDGYLADIHFIDGQALTPSSFTEVSATTGQLIPKAYTGTFGTNGFWLKFSDNSAATAATLGKDYSGNSNNWTPNNLSVTAGAGNDSLVDTPTSYGTPDTGVGNEVRGNYATLNPLLGSGTKSDGNLVTTTPNAYSPDISTIAPSSGKWYAEIQWTSGAYARIGIQNATVTSSDFGEDAYGWRYESNTGTLYGPSTSTSGSVYSNGDIIGIAFDCSTGKLWVSKNNTWQNSGNPAAGTNASATNLPIGTPLAVAMATGTGASVFTANFGQRAFAYTAPSGFKALCDTNIPEGTITTSGTYTGNGVADGPVVYLNGVPTAMTVGVNAVTFGTHADKLSNGFKLRTTNVLYNQNALSYSYSITTTGAKFKFARAQPNP